MYKHFGKAALLFLLAGVAIFFACNKDNTTTTQTATDYLDSSLYSIQERGGLGKYGCYELVFPVTVNFPDSTTQVVNSYDEMKAAITAWFQANGGGNPGGGNPGGGHGHHNHMDPSGNLEHPTLAFPLSVIAPDGTLITVNSESELHDLQVSCGGGTFDPHGHHGHSQNGLTCFEIQFPITVQFPDSTTATAADHKALHQLLEDWKHNNPTATSHPEIVFPITVIMKADSTVVTVNSKDDLKALKDGCK